MIIDKLTTLSEDEIMKKINDLDRRILFARRSSYSIGAIQQMENYMAMLQAELQSRQQQALFEQTKTDDSVIIGEDTNSSETQEQPNKRPLY